jgi:NAD(P)-dependent dehydrogenase (short-subunit alcohol dehydrogenase family)
MYNLTGRIALVTGAATGIGQVISKILSKAGANVVISDKPDINLEETEGLCKPFGREIFKVAIDVRNIEMIKIGFNAIMEKFGHLDILICNAGINRPTPVTEVNADNWDDHFNTNVRGGFFCAKEAIVSMVTRKFGRIIFISSQSGLVGIPGQSVYCATKGAIVNMVRAIGVEYAKYGITVNSIAPTFIETNLTRKRLQNKKFYNYVIHKIPIGRLATCEDVANAVVYLASEEANMVNCVSFPIDGGWTAW